MKITNRHFLKILGIGIAMVFACFAILFSDADQKKFEQKGRVGSSYEIREADNMAMIQMTIERPLLGYGVLSNEFHQRGKSLENITSSNGLLAITSQIGIPFFSIRQVLFCKFMRKKRIFPSPSRLSKLYLPSIHRVVPRQFSGNMSARVI